MEIWTITEHNVLTGEEITRTMTQNEIDAQSIYDKSLTLLGEANDAGEPS